MKASERKGKGKGIRDAEGRAESEEARRLEGRAVSVRVRGEGV